MSDSPHSCTCARAIAQDAARVHVSQAEAEVVKAMRDVRATGKCGIIVLRWDQNAWCIHPCPPPKRVNE